MHYKKELRRKNMERLSIEPWSRPARWTLGDIDSWVVCIDGQTIGGPLNGTSASAVLKWLAGALTDIEILVRREMEDSSMFDDE